uniref:glycine-rich protein n=1 Tax=Odoribacter lunatus TaxID=2941335 RepID=UPI00203BBA71
YVAIHAIEMAYIPYGSYYLGDNYSAYSFAKSGISPCLIDSEDAVTLNTVNPTSTSVTLPAAFPKGYNGFYIMKYETSQEQYMEFLNSLTLEQQKTHVANNDFANMQRGDYVFGDIATPTRRNGIVFIEQKKEGVPAVFGNNLNPANDLFSPDDGQTLACNYLSPYDMLAYCDWSGLRPMSELEYEKACRRLYPQIPEKGEYAWNSNNGVNPLTDEDDLLYPGDEREQSLNEDHNVNSDYFLNGPVRCGLFATSSTSQIQAGATCWGVMEMSGNLAELCYIASTAAKNFDYSIPYSHGDGELTADGSADTDVDYWPTAAGAFGTRGGGYNNPDSLLRASNRTKAQGTTLSSITSRSAFHGFRGVRSVEKATGLDGGTILCPNNTTRDTICANVSVKLTGVLPNNNVGKLSYSWYYSSDNGSSWTLFSGSTGADLHVSCPNTTTTYKIYKMKRKVTCAVGVAEAIATLYVAPNPWPSSVETITNKPPLFTSFTVDSRWGNMPQTHWKLDTPPAGISISNQGLVTGLTANSVFWTNVTVSSDKCPGIEYTKKLVIQREFSSGTSTSIMLAPGEYVMECYGAQGGRGRTNWTLNHYGGYGAYTKGTIQLSSNQVFYAYVGEQGHNDGICAGGVGGWNGGGTGGRDKNCDNNQEPGGGGGGVYKYDGYSGGTLSATGGAKQNSGYAFGYGQDGATYNGGSGGGGYYGGYSQQSDSGYGYGGSSFISGYSGCDAVNSSGSHTGQSIHYSGLQFYNASMTAGTRSGDGLVRISPVVP